MDLSRGIIGMGNDDVIQRPLWLLKSLTAHPCGSTGQTASPEFEGIRLGHGSLATRIASLIAYECRPLVLQLRFSVRSLAGSLGTVQRCLKVEIDENAALPNL